MIIQIHTVKIHAKPKNNQSKIRPDLVNLVTNQSECSRYFLKKIGLTTHFNSVHLKLKSHECDQCSASFSRKKNRLKQDVVFISIWNLSSVVNVHLLFLKILS